jgi:glycosyltransferase involved in cell wall biosynthesis
MHVVPSLDVGGVQTRIADIANGLAGFEHVFLPLDRSDAALTRLDAKVQKTIAQVSARAGRLPARLRAYARTIKEHQPDLLLTYNWGSIEFALANLQLGFPHIHSEDGFGPDESRAQLTRRVWTRRVALLRSVVVVPSTTLERIATSSWWVSGSRLYRIPNGIDLAKFAPRSKREARRLANIPDDALVVGWVGALRREKNVERLMRAFARLTATARLVVVGHGAERSNLEQAATALAIGDRVIWTGGRDDVGALLPAFDVFALSSDTEQMPIVIMEAMACGLPIASVDAGDIAQMVAPANAPFVVPMRDDALSEALQELASDEHLRTRIGAENRKRAEDLFDRDRMLAAYERLYRSQAGTAARARV